jgi:iduronate 2-sulfatase
LTREEARFENVADGRARKLPKGAAYEVADVPDNTYADGKVADEAVRRLKSAAKHPDEPFFLAVGFVKPHLPFCAPKKYWDLYDPADIKLPQRRTPPDGAPAYAPTTWGELRQYQGVADEGLLPDEQQRTLIHGYYAATSYMDAQVGRVLAALDETGLAKNTIIVFWGDHGWHLGDHGMWCKHSNYEQAARIPLLVVAPGVATAGSESAALVESVDVYPTLCELAGLETPADLDGVSFVKNLRDPSAEGETVAFHVYPRGERLGRAVRTARYRLVEWKKPGAPAETAELELYDYQADPQETKNLAAEQPEVVAELRGMLDRQPEAKPQITAREPQRQRKAGQQRRARARAGK